MGRAEVYSSPKPTHLVNQVRHFWALLSLFGGFSMIYLDRPIVNYENKIVWAGRASDFLPFNLRPPIYLLNGLKFKDQGQSKTGRAQAMNAPNSQLAEGVFFLLPSVINPWNVLHCLSSLRTLICQWNVAGFILPMSIYLELVKFWVFKRREEICSGFSLLILFIFIRILISYIKINHPI